MFIEPLKIKRDEWKEEWLEMPEFIQEKQEPYSKLIIRFRNEKDLQDFANLINQNLNQKTGSIWFPKLEINSYINKRWISES